MSPQPRIVNLDGVKHTFPSDATDDEIRQALGGPNPSVSRETVPGMEQLGGTPPKPPIAPFAPGGSAVPNELKPEDQQDNSFWTSPKGLIRTGLREAGQGIAAMTRPTTDEKLGAASQVVRGIGKAALPVAIPLAVANPVAAVGTLAGGAIGGAATGAAARALDAGPGAQALAEDAGSIVGGGLGGKAGGAISRGVKQSFNLKPDVAIEKIWRPTPADSDFPQVTQDALADVKTYGNPNVRTNADTKLAAQAAIDTLQQHLDQWLTAARTRGIRVSGDDIVRATVSGIPDTMKLEDPEGAAALIQQARRAYGGKQFTTDQFRQYLKEKNAGSAGFYGKSGARQQAGVVSGTPEALEKIQGDAIRETLYQALDPENAGAGPREIQSRTGKLYDLRNAADRRANAITGEKTVSGAQTIQRLAGIPGKLFHGDAEGAFNSVANPGDGVSDPMISRLFGQTGSAPPIPTPAGVVRNLNPRYALGPGGASPIAAGPITPDASFVRSAPGMPEVGNQRRLGPGGPSPVITPPPPDMSFVRGRQGMTQPPNPARAIPQGDIIPPSDFEEPVFGPVQGHYPNAPNPRRALPPASTIIAPKYPAPDASPNVGATPPTQLPPASEGSFVRGVNAPINPKTGNPWTAEEIKTYIAALPKYAKGGIIRAKFPAKHLVEFASLNGMSPETARLELKNHGYDIVK